MSDHALARRRPGSRCAPPSLATPARLVALLLLTALGLGGGAAVADPASPTHYRSTITSIEDRADQPVDLDIEVLGGDAYLVLSAPAGSEVEVPGYDGEPYIRILTDGTVEVNERSPARWLNDARYGAIDVDVPAAADADAPPAWVVVARSGTYAWHDHRIHFMSPTLPSQVDPAADEVQRVWEWEIPVVVDGEPVVVSGVLDWVPGSGVGLPVGAFVIALAGAVLLARRGDDGIDVLLLGAAALGVVLGVATNTGLPAGADTMPATLVLPVVAAVVVALGRWLRQRGDRRAPWLTGLAAVPSVVVSAMLIGALTRPIVPGLLPTGAVRAAVVLIAACAIGALVALAGRVVAATSLDAPQDA
jgi:hypothetical protein